jgi:GNAT superfamily N-acetyltransferase
MTPSDTGRYPETPTRGFPVPPRSVEDREGRQIEVTAVGEEAIDDLVGMYVEFSPEDRAQGIPPTGEGRVRDWLEGVLPSGYDVVATHEGTVVGHAMLVPDGDGEYELAIFVLDSYQGAGIGTALIETLLGYGAAEGVERVWLTVEPWNRAAIHLYEKVGFEPCDGGSFEREFAIRLG